MKIRLVQLSEIDFVNGGMGNLMREMREETRRESPSYTTKLKRMPIFMTEADYDQLKAIAKRQGKTTGEVVTAWIQADA